MPRNTSFFSRSLLVVVSSLVLLSGCTVNQVTGERQLSMPFAEQIKIGNEQYGPAQQQQGGRYVVDPELNLYVNQVGQSLAVSSPVKLPFEFVVLNNDVPNAWALPGGKIAVNRGLLILLEDEAQLAAVLGHEIVHAAAEHSANQMRNAQIAGVTALVVGVAAAASDHDNAALISLGAVVGSQAYQAHYGRSQELQADFYGIDYMVNAGYDPMASVELQQTFVSLSNGKKSNYLSSLFASHPPSQERVKKNQQKVAKLPSGKRNKKEYQRAIAQLHKDQPAYKEHAAAQQAAAEKNYVKALQLNNKAIKLQANEAQFYVTKGQILSAQNQHQQARDAFAQAAKKNPEYFMAQLGLGLSENKLKRYGQAKPALLKSYNLLPTSTAIYELGQAEEGQGNKEQAIVYYRKAAGENSDIGRAAQQKLRDLNAG